MFVIHWRSFPHTASWAGRFFICGCTKTHADLLSPSLLGQFLTVRTDVYKEAFWSLMFSYMRAWQLSSAKPQTLQSGAFFLPDF